MKKISLLLFTFIIIVLILFIPFKQQKTLNIKAQFFITIQQLLQPNSWKKWQPEVRKAWQKDSTQVKINQQNPSFSIEIPGSVIDVNISGFTFKVDKNSIWQNNYSFVILPKLKDGTALFTIVQKNNLFNLLMNSPGNDLNALKVFMEDTRQYYGFDIRRTTVADSNIVVEKKLVLLKNKASEVAQTEQELKAYVQQQNLRILQPVIADIRSIAQDSLRLMIGLPVDKQTVSAGKIQFMHQPPHGHMLIGLYTGKYGGRQRLYLAMKTYMSDHNLSSPEDAYEKYLDNKIPLSDSSLVRLQVNFPVY